MPANDKIKDADVREISLMPSTIETIDEAMFRYLDEKLNIHSTTNKGWNKVPSIWVSAERAYQIKHNKDLRDSRGVLKLPLMTLSRNSIAKDPNFKGTAWAHIPVKDDAKGGAITVARLINQEKTANFKNAHAYRHHRQYNFPSDKKMTVYETITMPVPTYVTVMYTIGIKAEYQQQINEILTPFVTKTGQINNFFITSEGHRFEGFIQNDFSQADNTANMGDSERSYESSISVKILGYLLGDGPNAERPKVTIRENAVTLVQTRERVSLGDDVEHFSPTDADMLSKHGFYRE